MHHHASLTANLPSLSLASLFQAAAGRAWARTRPTRAYHRTSVRPQGAAHSNPYVVQREYDSAGGPTASTSRTPCAAPPPLHDGQSVVNPSHPRYPTSAPVHHAANAAHGPDIPVMQASAGPASCHLPQRNIVVPFDVERLSPQEFAAPRCSPSGPSTYESDPPWEEIRDSVPESLLPRISPRSLPVPKSLATIPNPSTPEDLLTNLTLAITATPPASIGQLLSYHAAHRELHSTASYNLLIKFAIRHASFGTVQDLLGRMVREGIAGDLETRALRVRCMVRSGFWDQAWREEMAQMREDGQEMPISVWLEFFGSGKRGAIQIRTVTQGRARAVKSETLQPPDPSVTAERLSVLLRHAPLVAQTDLEKMPPRAVYALVRSFIEVGQWSVAVTFTTTYFKSLPRNLDEDWLRSCLSIIHLHMKPGRRSGLTEHYAICKTLFGFLDMHPSFRPTSTTLLFLLRSLRRTKRCGERAAAVVQSFAERWGPDIVDDAVRRRVAAYWLKQGKWDRAAAVVEAQDELDKQRVAWRAEKEAAGGDSAKDRARRLRWLDLHKQPRKNKERRLWMSLRRRLRRAQMRGP